MSRLNKYQPRHSRALDTRLLIVGVLSLVIVSILALEGCVTINKYSNSTVITQPKGMEMKTDSTMIKLK